MYDFDKLCFEGCGVFGIIYIGALAYLQEQDLLDNISEYAGTSSGSIVAAMLALGYSPKEMYSVFEQLDWGNMYDYNFGIFNLFSGYGLYKGDKIHKFYKTLIKNKTNSENTTFKELYERTNKKLHLCAVNIRTQESIYFSSDTAPDMEIHLAIRLSTSFPFVFKSLKYKDDYYVDGGVMDNYPIEVFKDCERVLGLNLETNVNKIGKVNNIFDFTKNIISAMTKSQNILELHPYKKQTVCIYNEADDLLTSVMEIGKMKDNMPNYFKLGYDTIKLFFREHSESVHITNVESSPPPESPPEDH